MPNVIVNFGGQEAAVRVSPEHFRAFLQRRKALHKRALELEGTVNFLGGRIPEEDYERVKALNAEKAKDPVGFQALGFAQEARTRAEIEAAVAAWLSGDRSEATAQALYEGLRPVIEAVALTLARGSLANYEDLRQEGFAFLLEWLEKARFRGLTQRVDFTALFAADLRVHLEDLVAKERGGVTISMNMARLIRRVIAVKTDLEAKGETATPEAIAEALGEKLEAVERALSLASWLELDAPVGEDGDAAFGDLIPAATPDPAAVAEARQAEAEAKAELEALIERAQLTEAEAEAIKSFREWGYVPRTQKEALNKALAKLRAAKAFPQAA